MALVISDWGENTDRLTDLLMSVTKQTNDHIFKEVVVITSSQFLNSKTLNETLLLDWELFASKNISVCLCFTVPSKITHTHDFVFVFLFFKKSNKNMDIYIYVTSLFL
jgi:hypothetical protein